MADVKTGMKGLLGIGEVEHMGKGIKYWDRKEYSEALKEWKAASEFDPRNGSILMNIGVGYLQLGNLQIALEFLQ